MLSGSCRVANLGFRWFCVGNLTVGGTGKTPFTAMLARWLLKRGLEPVILSRGYRAETVPERPLIVSDGDRLLTGPDRAGDEACAMAEYCKGIPLVVHPDRYRAGKRCDQIPECQHRCP